MGILVLLGELAWCNAHWPVLESESGWSWTCPFLPWTRLVSPTRVSKAFLAWVGWGQGLPTEDEG